eukprot:GHVS01030835.1.p1 GENE.GHVS01030835.1~~GHVS01030835.1.p1  ORF type:complete len:457 (+),score=39.26 GHVS01030835.1:115-1485(+)
MESDEEAYSNWPVGVVVALIGSIAGAVGDNVIRLEYTKAGPQLKPADMFKRWRWIVGLLLTTVVDIGCTLTALAFAPATIITPFAGVHIFWNIFLAKFWLREKVGFWEILGSISVIAGVVLIVVFAGKGSKIVSMATLAKYAISPLSITYMTITAAALIASFFLSTDFGAGRLPLNIRKPIQRLAVASSSGLLGGCTNISAKTLMIVATQLFQGDSSIMRDWQTYIIFIATITLGVSQFVYLNVGLRRYEAIYIVPTINSCLVGSGNVGGVMVLQEYPQNWSGFFVGLVVAVAGILALTISHTSRDFVKQKTMTRSKEFIDKETPSDGQGELCRPPTEAPTEMTGYSPSALYRHVGQNICRSVSSICGAQLAVNPSSLHVIQSMQEMHTPERSDVLTSASPQHCQSESGSASRSHAAAVLGMQESCDEEDGGEEEESSVGIVVVKDDAKSSTRPGS